jgi:hypothetical protein
MVLQLLLFSWFYSYLMCNRSKFFPLNGYLGCLHVGSFFFLHVVCLTILSGGSECISLLFVYSTYNITEKDLSFLFFCRRCFTWRKKHMPCLTVHLFVNAVLQKKHDFWFDFLSFCSHLLILSLLNQ